MNRRNVLLGLASLFITLTVKPLVAFATDNKNTTRYRINLQKQLNICNEIIVVEFGPDATRFKENVIAQFDEFSSSIPDFKDKNNRYNFDYGPLLLSVYRTLKVSFGYNDERQMGILYKMINKITHHNIQHSGLALKLAYKRVGKSALFGKVMAKYFKYTSEPGGWSAEVKSVDGVYLAADMTSCGLHKWLTANNAGHICKVACDSDFIVADAMPWLNLKRDKTIAYGDEVCAFRYYAVKG